MRTNISRSTTCSTHDFLFIEDLGEPKVADHDLGLRGTVGKQQIFRLQVTMGDPHGMEVVHSTEDFVHDLCSVGFRVLAPVDNFIKQLATSNPTSVKIDIII